MKYFTSNLIIVEPIFIYVLELYKTAKKYEKKWIIILLGCYIGGAAKKRCPHMTANGAGAPYAQSGAAAGRRVRQKMFLQKQIIK
jgi:hypothetical protein